MAAMNAGRGLPPLLAILGLFAGSAVAGEADVVGARATQGADGTWRVSATVRHADAGWDHYADAWEVLDPDGKVLGTRVLLHPHDDEQPFTRDLTGLRIPDGIASVTIRARDKVHEYGGRSFIVELPRR